MSLSRRAVRLVGLASALLAMTAIWLVLHNPAIDGTSRGDDYTCLAPYDTVLNRADNLPGGEPPPDGEEIGARCRDLGGTRFTQGVVAGAAAVVLAALTTVPGSLSRRRTRRE